MYIALEHRDGGVGHVSVFHYGGGLLCINAQKIKNRTRISSKLEPINTTLEEFENVALFLRLGLASTLIRHENFSENALQTGGI